MKRAVEFFTDAQGQLSSKRLFALGCFVSGVVAMVLGRDAATCGVFIAAASTTLMAQAISHT